jgi:hypothetical protein
MDNRLNHNNAGKDAHPHSRNTNIMNKTTVMNRTNYSFVSQQSNQVINGEATMKTDPGLVSEKRKK